MNNITFFTHLKAQFHKKFRLSGDTKDIYFINKSTVRLLGKIDDVRFVVSLPMNGKVVSWECSYKNEPMKNGVFNVTIEPGTIDRKMCWYQRLHHKFVISMTTSLNNLSIDTLLEGFNLAYNYYKSVRATTEQFINDVDNSEEGYQNFKAYHVSMEKDWKHKHEINLGQLHLLFAALGYERAFDGQEDTVAYIDDLGEMLLDAVLAQCSFGYEQPLKSSIPAPATKAEEEEFFNKIKIDC